MQKMSITEEKRALRSVLKKKRSEIALEIKKYNDKKIQKVLLNLSEIKSADIILTYVSTKDEIDTRNFIKALLDLNKTVAVAKCEDNVGKMSFYKISSLSELKESSFGILEPKSCDENRILQYDNSVCIVPALAYDKKRQRIGYGKGYYDRFLEKFKGIKIGLCYDELLEEKIPCDKLDIAVDMVVTQSKII